MQREFYLIGHNPNTVESALNVLKSGANSLEPDVHFDSGQFFVGEISNGDKLTLVDYLKGLTQELVPPESNLNLALIAFDVKDSNGNILNLLGCIRDNCANSLPGVSITITRSKLESAEQIFFSAAANQLQQNEGLGVDESTNPEDVNNFFQKIQVTRFTYGNGISAPIIPTTLYKASIQRAIKLRNAGNSFGLVYPWTVNGKSSMRTYLDMDIDGIITDNIGTVKRLIENEYAQKYILATNKNKKLWQQKS